MGRFKEGCDARIATPIVALLLSGAVLVGQAEAAIQFEDVTASAGINDFSGESYGASWGDLNGDRWPDLFISHHRTLASLYVNDTTGGFTDEANSVSTWTSAPNRDQHGGAWADFDNDGDYDFSVTTGRGNDHQFFVNESGQLIDRTAQYGLTYSTWAGRLPVWFDYNNDRKLDFIVPQFNGLSQVFLQTGSGFANTTVATGAACSTTTYAQLLDLNNDGRMELLCARSGPFPYKAYNYASVPFADVTNSIPAVSTVIDTALGDFDRNLRQDIFYVRSTTRQADFIQTGNNALEAALVDGTKGIQFNSNGSITVTLDWVFVDEGNLSKIKIGSSGYSPPSVPFTIDPGNSATWGIKTHNPADSPAIYFGFNNNTKQWTVVHYTGGVFSNLYLQVTSTASITGLQSTGFGSADGPLSPVLNLRTTSGFVNQTNQANLGTPISCSSAVTADFDNDMDQDLYIACRAGAENLANILYENRGNGVFDLVPAAGGAEGPKGAAVASGAGTAESVVAADYDLDGFIDIFVTNGMNMRPEYVGGPDKLFRNRGNSNKWIEIDLEGTTSNRDGVGARVIATAGGVAQLREQNGGYHRWSQDNQRIHFGLANNSVVDLRIEWPSGKVDLHDGIIANQLYRAVEDGELVVVPIGGVNPAEPTLAIDDISVSEGAGIANFNVTLSPTTSNSVTVDYFTADASALAGEDYTYRSGTLLFDPDVPSRQVSVPIIDDNQQELAETFTVELTNPLEAIIGDSSGIATITDNELSACGRPAYDTSTDRAVFIWQDCPNGAWHIRYTAAGGYIKYDGNVTSNQPFVSRAKYSVEASDIFDLSDPNALTFEQRISPPYEDGADLVPAAGASVCFDLEAPAGAPVYIGAERAPAPVLPLDLTTLGPCGTTAEPTLSIADVATPEGAGNAVFSVSLLPAATEEVSVDYTTGDIDALAGLDYTATAGTLVIPATETSGQITVPLTDDGDQEGNESFTVTLSNESGAVLGDNSATGTIIDDEVTLCGEPSYNQSTDRAVFLWQDCSTGVWSARYTAAGGYIQYVGSVDSDMDFINVTKQSQEASDVFDSTTDPSQISYMLRISPPYFDGYDFSVPAGASVCFGVTAPASAEVFVGPDRTPVATPFRIDTLEPC